MEEEKSAVKKTILKDKTAAALCYLFFWIGGLVFLFIEKDNRFIRFHAMQSLLTFGAVTAFFIVIGIIERIILFTAAWNIKGLFILINMIDIISSFVTLMAFLLWLFMIIKSLQGENVKLPYFGKQVDSLI